MSFILGCMISVNAGLLPRAFAEDKVSGNLAPQQNISATNKVKNVSKKGRFVKNSLKVAGGLVLGGAVVYVGGVIWVSRDVSSLPTVLMDVCDNIDSLEGFCCEDKKNFRGHVEQAKQWVDRYIEGDLSKSEYDDFMSYYFKNYAAFRKLKKKDFKGAYEAFEKVRGMGRCLYRY